MQERVLTVLSLAVTALLLVLVLFGSLAPGASGLFLTGLEKPVLGLPHFLTLLGVGAWAGRLGRPSAWIVPGSLTVGMVPGFVFGVEQPSIVALDLVISGLLFASLVPLALAAAIPVRLSTRDAVTAMMVLGGLHGHLLGAGIGRKAAMLLGLGALASIAVLLALGGAVGVIAFRSR